MHARGREEESDGVEEDNDLLIGSSKKLVPECFLL